MHLSWKTPEGGQKFRPKHIAELINNKEKRWATSWY